MNAIAGLLLYLCASASSGTCVEPLDDGELLRLARVALGSQTSSVLSLGSARPRPGAEEAVAARLQVCLVRRLLQVRNGSRVYASVGRSCEDYSTQTSSAWARGGPRCAPDSPFAHLARCSERAIAARDGMRRVQWSTFERRAPRFRDWMRRWARGDVTPPAGTERAAHTTMCPIVDGARRCTGGAERFRGISFAGSNGLWATPDVVRAGRVIRRGSASWTDAELPRRIPWEDGCDVLDPGD